MIDNFSSENSILDLREGCFTDQQPAHPHFVDGKNAALTAELLKVMQPGELKSFKLNHEIRRELLVRYLEYYALHIPDFGQMKTLVVLHEVF